MLVHKHLKVITIHPGDGVLEVREVHTGLDNPALLPSRVDFIAQPDMVRHMAQRGWDGKTRGWRMYLSIPLFVDIGFSPHEMYEMDNAPTAMKGSETAGRGLTYKFVVRPMFGAGSRMRHRLKHADAMSCWLGKRRRMLWL